MNKKIITALTCALITFGTSALPTYAMLSGSGTIKVYNKATGEVYWMNAHEIEADGDTIESFCEKKGYIYINVESAKTIDEEAAIEAAFKAEHPNAHYADLGFNHSGIKREEFGTVSTASTASTASTVQTMSDGTKFDPVYYAAANPDVVAAFGTSTNALYNHYVKYGKAEGRLPYAGATASASTVQTMSDGTKFDPVYYAAANPDVVAAFGTSTNALYNHYVKYGKAEGRLPYAR